MRNRSSGLTTETLAKLACAFCGAVWGIFWIPLRWLETIGIEGAWASVVFFIAPLLLLAPPQLLRWRALAAGGAGLQLTSFLTGTALALYSLSLLYTDVIRAILLYYLTPLWSTLLARWFLNEPITQIRWVSIVLAVAGMLVIFGIDIGFPWPRNLGDWMGLASGIVWALAAVRLRLDRHNTSFELTFGFVFWGSVVSLGVTLAMFGGRNMPGAGEMLEAMPWMVLFALLAILPASWAANWGPKHIDPGIVGLLFMTEISVGAITVALWAGEPLGWRELAGIVLISAAGVLEPSVDLWRRRSVSTRGTG